LKTYILAQQNKIKYGNYHFKEIKGKKKPSMCNERRSS
jgi:hypothetical protein